MVLERPAVLFALAFLVVLGVLWRLSFRRGARTLRELGGAWRFEALMDVYLFKSFFSMLFLALFFVASILAISGVRWGETLVEERRGEREIVFLVDLSNSMLARDVPAGGEPISRLEVTRRVIGQVARSMASTRFAIVGFKGEAVKLMPLTEDIVALEGLLPYLGPGVMTVPGSDLQAGLEAALGAFSEGRRPYRTVLLFSDGESLSGNPNLPALQAGREGVPIYAFAVGSEAGAEVLLPGGEPVRDRRGEPVVSRLRPEVLERIATVSGGKLYRLKEPAPGTAEDILAELRGVADSGQLPGLRPVQKDRFRLFLALAAAFLSVAVLVRSVRWRDTL
ncbi:MAG: VWA domain-containing protein [Spirochaetales bacterium]|nr:VWA domain-containing protein [Spirochaetales bacterium]